MTMCVIGLVVLGWLSLTRLPLEFLPEFSRANVWVSVPYASSSAQEVERELVRPLEDALGTLNGLETLSSTASPESASVNLEFVEGTDMDLASVEVRDRIDRARPFLPDDVERVWIRRFQSSDIPVISSSIGGEMEPDKLYAFVEEVVQPRLERLEGVAQVDVRGLRTKEIRIELVPARLAAHGVDVRDVARVLREGNVNVSGGYIREGSRRLMVRSIGEFESLDEIRRLPLGQGALRIDDIADVVYDYPERTSYSFLNGEEAIYVSINKTSTANLLAVANRVKAEYTAINESPEGAQLEIRHFRDASVDVTEGLSSLVKAGLIGGGLAIVFMYLFLRRFRTTLLIAIAIPISLVATFVIIYLMRQADLTSMTLNVMSLMGLMLAVGMLFDNSIVVIESIFRYRQEKTNDSKQAALEGASAVAMPIIASTATTVCVFLPMIFFGGSGGMMRFMGDVGLTVVIVMVASLIVSLTVVPMVASLLLRSEVKRDMPLLEKMIDVYGAILRFTLHHRVTFAIGIVLLLWGSWKMYSGIERSFSPPSHGRQLTLFVDTPKRFSVTEREALFQEIYDHLDAQREEYEIADITHRFSTGGGRSGRGDWGGSNRYELYLTPEDQAQRTSAEISESIDADLPLRSGVTYKVRGTSHGPPGMGGSTVEMELVGEDMEILELLSPTLVERLEQIPVLKDVDTSLESGDDEIVVSVDRERALQAGMSSQAVATSVNNALSSRNLSYFKSDEREVGMVMQYREQDRQTLDQLRTLPLRNDGTSLQIGSVADFEVVPGARSIERENRRAKITISAESRSNAPSFALMGSMRGTLAAIGLPEGYEWRFGRSFFDAEDDARGAMFALLFAVMLIYMIMASLFENFAQPFVIMFSIPFAFTGVGIVMTMAGQSRTSSADMGLIILAGIVVNNAIVLVDHINRLRRDGMRREEAVVLGGKHRLRPILMTAVTTILGLSPMAAPFFLPEIFGQPEGRAAQWAPTSLVILGGLTTSTFFTLLVTPTIYTLVDDFTRFLRRLAAAA